MNKNKEDLLLHPIRLRVILAVAGRQMTAQQLARELQDIPQATLYRNINLLVEAGILSVVHQRRVHNIYEKTYALPSTDLLLTVEDLKNAKPEDYVRLFTQLLGSLLGYYARYIQKGDIDLTRDHVLSHMFSLYLSQAEMQQVSQAVNAALLPHLKNEPTPERQQYILGMVSIPDVSGAPTGAGLPASSPAVGPTGSKMDQGKQGENDG